MDTNNLSQKVNQQYKEVYLRILDQFPNPIWRAGLDAKCDFFNQAWLDFTGRELEQEMGDGWVEGVAKEDLDRCVKTYLDAFKKREKFQMEYRLRHKDGTYHWLLDSGSPFFDDDGKFLGYIGSCYDIDNSKKYTSEIESINKLMVDRELKMVELKEKIITLQEKVDKLKTQ